MQINVSIHVILIFIFDLFDINSTLDGIYVGDLDSTATEAQLDELFSKYGKIQRRVIIRDKNTGNGRGYGFVYFQDEASLSSVMEHQEDLVCHFLSLN